MKEPAVPTKEGYIFAGWYSDSACTKTFDFKNTKITSDTKIYAKFVSEDEKFTVSFNSNGGSSVASQTVNAGEKAVKPTDPTKANFKFAGWYCDAALTEAYDFSTPVLSNITLYAKWTAESGTYTVTFNSNGGSAVPAQTVKAGEKAVKPTNPTKSGCTFSGWYSDAALTTQYNFNSAVTANITLYAKWTTSSGGGGGGGPSGPTYYTVTFDANNGSFVGDTATTKSIRVESGKTIANIPEVTRPGYAFLGWNTKADETGDAFTISTAVTSSCTVYAQWSSSELVSTVGSNPTINLSGDNSADNLVGKAEELGSSSIVFDASAGNTLQISKDNLSGLDTAMTDTDVTSLTFVTEDGSVTIGKESLSPIAESLQDGDNLVISINDVTDALQETNPIKSTVGDAPVFQVSIKNGTEELNLPPNSEIRVTIACPTGIADTKDYKIFYVTDGGIVSEAYDIKYNEGENTISFTITHNSYYAILPIDDASLVNHAVNSVNAWMETAGLGKLFAFTIDQNDPTKITLMIDADQVFGDNNALQSMKPDAFNGFLTNFGNFVDTLFGDTTISVIVNDLRGNTTSNTIFDANGVNAMGLKNFILDFGYGFFEIISNMIADDSDNYPFKTMNVTLGNSATPFNVAIVFTGDNMQSILSFAGTVADHISMSTDAAGNPVIELKAPDALMNKVYEKARAKMTSINPNLSDLASSVNMSEDEVVMVYVWQMFLTMPVEDILKNIGELEIDNVFGSNDHAISRLISIVHSNQTVVNKIFNEILSIKYHCPVDGNRLTSYNELMTSFNGDLYNYSCPETCNGHDLLNTTDLNMSENSWSAFISAVSTMLSTDASKAKPGDFYIGNGNYQLDVTMSLGLEELGMGNVPISFTLVMDIFDDNIDTLMSKFVTALSSQN